MHSGKVHIALKYGLHAHYIEHEPFSQFGGVDLLGQWNEINATPGSGPLEKDSAVFIIITMEKEKQTHH
jgi:hypothetical protein